MTLVVNMEFEGFKCMLGDLCLSARVREGYPVDLPSNSDFESPTGKGKSIAPVALAQKLVKCGSNLLVGWSGKSGAARQLLSELRRLNDSDDLTFSQLKSYFSTSSFGRDLVITGLITDSGGCQSFTFGDETSYVDIQNRFGCIRAVGTGAKSYEEMLRGIDFNDVAANVSPVERAKIAAFVVACALWSFELADPVCFESTNVYGGGYEVAAVCKHGSILKMDKVAYLFWEMHIDANGNVIAGDLNLAFWLLYLDDVLVIRRFTSHTRHDTRFPAFANYFIPPIDCCPTSIELKDKFLEESRNKFDPTTTFVPNILCNWVAVTLPGQEGYSLISVNIAPPSEQLIWFSDLNGKMAMDGIDLIRLHVEKEVRIRQGIGGNKMRQTY